MTEGKFSFAAAISEIAENDYNLNIPRYVDTFEEEEAVDLAEVTKELSQINMAMESIDIAIKEYCDELGIEAPLG